MSRATATPPTGRPASPAAAATVSGAAAQPGTTVAPPAATPSAPVSRRRAERLARAAMEGTPGRMRLLGLVAALAAAVFGLVGATSLWSAAGALDRADHNTQQVVRIQGIYADLVRADADATNAFLVGGLEDTARRADYDASLARVATGITAAAEAQPADSAALGVLNGKVQTYASTVEQARVYNRQGLPVGAQYLNEASASLRSDTLPIVESLRKANTDRANTEFAASSSRPALFIVGAVAFLVLVLVMVWLARRTHRYLNASMGVGALLVLLAIAVGAITLGGIGSQVTAVRDADFRYTVALASARTAAFDAKSNESLTLIARGSGGKFQAAWLSQSDVVESELAALPDTQEAALKANWTSYKGPHQAIRALDDGGQWDQAVTAATATGAGTANAAFATFDTETAKALANDKAQTSASLTAPIAWVTVLGWLLLALCVAAALLVLRGIGQRVEEYR
jgi:hypothetical protein